LVIRQASSFQEEQQMKDHQYSQVSNGSASKRRANGALTRRELMGALGASAVGAGLLGTSSRPLEAQTALCPAGGPIIDTHIHIWKLPRSSPPVSDFGTYPGTPADGFCCTVNASNPSGAVPWLQQDALMPNYQANWGGRRVNQVVVIESSVGVTPANIIQSNLWMLDVAANDTNGPDGGSKILSVVGALDTTQPPLTFGLQLAQLSSNPLFVGIRLGDLGSIFTPNADRTFANLQPSVLQNIRTLAGLGLQIDANGIPGAVLAQIGQATGISIVMDHFASEGNTFTPSDAWKADMKAAAAYSGLHIKVSDVETLSEAGVGGYTFGPSQFQPIADATQYYPVMEFLWNLFGYRRLLWGSNWPVCRYGGVLTDPVDFEINIWESFLSQQLQGRDEVMYKNALRVYGPGSSSRV
jgi:predicted TIM-barrel fold metal-dependent hydrolase